MKGEFCCFHGMWLIVECSPEEFNLNWCCQCPHWQFLTEEGINFWKGTKGVKYKRPEDEIL